MTGEARRYDRAMSEPEQAREPDASPSLRGVPRRVVESLADTMFVLSTPSRVQILLELADRPHDVSELVQALDMRQSAISHQLRVLREHGLVRVERDGKRRVYALAGEHVAALLRDGIRHLEQAKAHRGPLAQLRRGAG